MPVFHDAKALAAHQRARAQKVRKSMEAAAEEAAQIARSEAENLTGGRTKQAALTAAGHPFARRRGLAGRVVRDRGGPASIMGSFPLLPINVQSGDLRRKWRIFKRRRGKSEIAWVLQNVSPHAVVLTPGGTRHMIDRQFFETLNQRALPKIRRKNLGMWREAHKG